MSTPQRFIGSHWGDGDARRPLAASAPRGWCALQLYEAMRADGLGRKDLTEAANVAAEQSGLSRFDD